jgi:hypothetical protein
MSEVLYALRANVVAQAASLVVKASKGGLLRITGFNALAGTQFLQVFDASALPADASVPLLVYALSASSPFEVNFGHTPMPMQNGIVVCNSTTGPTKTIGAANCLFTVLYQ